MDGIKQYWLFFGSLFLGIVIWCVVFLLLPAEPVEPVKTKTVLFIVLSYLMLIFGFISFKFKTDQTVKYNFDPSKTLNLLLVIILVSHVLRWVDLFYLRELSFSNEWKFNRSLNDSNFNKSNLLFVVASILKSIYFFPFVISVMFKAKLKKFPVMLSYVCLLLPILEAILKGNRKPVIEIFIIVVITVFVFGKRKINASKVVIVTISFILLLTISMAMLFKRENLSNALDKVFYEKLLEGRYNDILKPKPETIAYFKDEKQQKVSKFYAITAMHTGQYLTHGVFEFNHIIDNDSIPITYGKYTFVTVPKFINKIQIFDKMEYSNPSPRAHVYLTTFGGFFIDFRWMTLIVMFFMGATEKYVYQKSKQYFIYTPILIYFLIINVFLLILNYMRGAGIYPIISFIFLLLILKLARKTIHEKSIGS